MRRPAYKRNACALPGPAFLLTALGALIAAGGGCQGDGGPADPRDGSALDRVVPADRRQDRPRPDRTPRDLVTSGDAVTSDGARPGDAGVCSVVARGPLDATRGVAGWSDRSYSLHVPASYACHTPIAVVLALHGGGSNREAMAQVTCPGRVPYVPPGKLDAPGCLLAAADLKGFVVVAPDGTKSPTLPTLNVRTFNAGGGSGGYTCVSGYACENKTDDVRYVKELLADLARTINIDPRRIFVTGISNGAAMAHRLACELSTTIAAIAPVAGGNQLAAGSACAPQRPVPVLSIHGDADPTWPFLGGPAGGVATGNMVGIPASTPLKVGPSTVAGWVSSNGCGTAPATHSLVDADPKDGSTVQVLTYPGCSKKADVILYRIQGGGHTWPGGWQYFPVSQIGVTNRDIDAAAVILDFFKNHPMP